MPAQLHQPQQLDHLQHLGDAADPRVTQEVRGVSSAKDEVEGDDGDQVDQKPTPQVVLHYETPVVDDLEVFVVHGRVEDDNDVDQEEPIDRIINGRPRDAEVVAQSDLNWRDDAREEKGYRDEHVPVQLDVVRR